MANSLTISILVVFSCLSVGAEARTVIHSISDRGGNGMPKLFAGANDDGICKSVVEPRGYTCQEHKVITQDGYILSVQRLPVGRSGKRANRPPVLLQHGLFSDGIIWMLNSPDESLAFILADNGFDIWVSNTRGTNYSLGHTTFAPNDPAYWDWSWDELAAHDLPALVRYVHDQTGQKLHYVGHSLGTLMALAAFSQHKVLNMLRSAALLCPIAYLNQVTSLGTAVAAKLFLAEDLYWLGLHEFLPKGDEAAKLLDNICKQPGINCSDLMALFVGSSCCVNSSTIHKFLDHEPQPTSTKNLIHLAQMIRTGTIGMYDYGNEDDNMKHYGQSTPPAYDLTSIPNDFPLFLSHGGQDQLSDVNDVQVLLDKLKDHNSDNLVVQYRQEYAHADFILGVNAHQLIYDPIMAFFKLY